jgi:hypothetical protein
MASFSDFGYKSIPSDSIPNLNIYTVESPASIRVAAESVTSRGTGRDLAMNSIIPMSWLNL